MWHGKMRKDYMYCGTCGERIKNGEKICPFCGSEQTTLPQWKGISLDFISDKEEKEEPLEKNIKNRQEFVRYKVKRGGRNILPVGKSGEFAL